MDGGVPAGRFLAKKQFFKRGGRIETSAVDVSGQHYGPMGERSLKGPEWDLVKVAKRKLSYVRNVISRDQISLQLESLILAQSERWRQA